MKKKVVWLVVTGWMVVALLLTSCAPAPVKEAEKVAPPVKEKEEVVVPKAVVVPEKKGEWVKWTGTKRDGTVVEKMIEKPRYGGVYIYARDTQPVRFDSWDSASTWNIEPVVDELLVKDWTRGPGGTEEWDASNFAWPPLGMERGRLAERWELLDDTTLVFHIRKGIRFALDPTSEASRLVGGRELTADDVVFSHRRGFSPGAWLGRRSPNLLDMKNVEKSIYVSPTDKRAVVVKIQPGQAGMVFESVGDVGYIYPSEVIKKYGDMNDWKNVVGSGPFILKEYVGASSLTYVRNPNYWMKDPFFPENQLPYLDTLKALIIPDASTRQAALRTAKIDSMYGLSAEEAEPVLKTNPYLERAITFNSNTHQIAMRLDKPELPFDDIRVRRALALAINNHEILNVYYGGKAGILNFSTPPVPEFKDVYIPLEQLPESVRELYGYHPDKAKKLLAEAGYPQGFKTEILITAPFVDLLSIIKEYWAKIGVDLKLDVRDPTVFANISSRRTYAQMMINTSTLINPYLVRWGRVETSPSFVDDPKAREIYLAMNAAYFDQRKKDQLMRDLTRYALEQSWFIYLPTPHNYTLWQPWLKGFYGTNYASYLSSFLHPAYVWIDQELKKAMGR